MHARQIIPGIKSFIVGQLKQQVATQIQDTIAHADLHEVYGQDRLQRLRRRTARAAPASAADGKTCIQEVGLDGRIDVGKSWLAALARHQASRWT